MRLSSTFTSVRLRCLCLAVASCFAAQESSANPTAPVVTNGAATFVNAGSTLTVTNTPNAIIHWQSFSIDSGETTRFIQQSAASAVLNRVTGGDPSVILGALQSNGRVFLINPSGIVFGAGAQIDTAGLVASTLNMTDDDFMRGRMRFDANTITPGGVSNAGEIRTPNGGFVYLIAPQVENSGIISTPSGEAILAAGHAVEIVDSIDPNQRVLVSAQSGDLNLSQLMQQNNGNIFSVLNNGKVSANTVTQDASGRIYFKSAGSVTTTATSLVEAKGDNLLDGGRFLGFADTTGLYRGTFDTSGKNGGFIETSGHWLNVDDATIIARAIDPNGIAGTWLLDPYNVTITSSPDANGSLLSNIWTPSGPGSNIQASTIENALNAGTSVTIQTAGGGVEIGDITVGANLTKSSGGNASLTLNADHDIIFSPGITITSSSGNFGLNLNAANNIKLAGTLATSSTGSINVSLVPGTGKTITPSGDTLTLNASGGGIGILTENGKIWENSGTVILNGASYIDLQNAGTVGTFNNLAGGVVDINAGNWSFQSNNVTQGGVFNNAGIVNVNQNMSWEALFNNQSGGILNIASTKTLSMQNANILSGVIVIDTGATLILSEQHSGIHKFSNAIVLNDGTLSLGAWSTQFDNSNFYATGNLTLPSGTITYTGTNGFYAGGDLVVPVSISTTGNLMFASGGSTSFNNATITANALSLVAVGDININSGAHLTGNSVVAFANNLNVTAVGSSASLESTGSLFIDAVNNVTVKAGPGTGATARIRGAGGIGLSTLPGITAGGSISFLSNGAQSATIEANTGSIYVNTGSYLVDGVAQTVYNGVSGFKVGNLPAILNTNLFFTATGLSPAISTQLGLFTTELLSSGQIDAIYLEGLDEADLLGTGSGGNGKEDWPRECRA